MTVLLTHYKLLPKYHTLSIPYLFGLIIAICGKILTLSLFPLINYEITNNNLFWN
jgi:hypothetical protein